MPSIHETVYPRLKSSVSEADLVHIYTPSPDERALANRVAKGRGARLCFLLLLKTYQRLGYFVWLKNVPPQIALHVASCLEADTTMPGFAAYDESGTRRRHVAVIREHRQVRPYDEHAQQVVDRAIRDAASAKQDLADLINVAVEELVRQRFELPSFRTLHEEAQRVRAEVNRQIHTRVFEALGAETRQRIDGILSVEDGARTSVWQRLKGDPGRPTLTQLRELVNRCAEE